MSDLVGRRIIITGGASGMGEGMVRAFAKMGARVASLDISVDAGAAIAAQAGAAFVQCDVADSDSVTNAIDEAVNSLDGLDVLIHAAAITQRTKPVDETPLDEWQRVMTTNATGTFLTNVAAFRHLKSHGGRIINFASAAGLSGYPGRAAYAASKGAVLSWVRTVAAEWGRFGITVNSVCPMIWTPMYDTTRAAMSEAQLTAHDEQFRQLIPIGGKLGDIEQDLVPAVAFLAGEGSRFMTGQVMCVDGGKYMVR
jgi:NAD(P)-dependent dehydrogenase (short-subunit alcohol dehydrogenase family)